MSLNNEDTGPASALHQTPTGVSSASSLLLFVVVVVLFVAARLWRLTASCLWFDEIFSVHAARHSWANMMHFVAADIIHPPLFYALLKVWVSLGGESLLWLRLFPALISIATIVPFLLLCRELKLNSGEITLALLLMAVNGYLIKYAQELRMYSLLLFLSLCSLWLFVKFLNTEGNFRKHLLALFAVNLLLGYTHYAGWLVVVLQAVALVVWRPRKLSSFLLASGALCLAYMPWIYAVATAKEPGKGLGQNIGWVSRPHLSDVVQYFTLLNKPFLFRQSTGESTFDPLSTLLAVVLFGLPLVLFSRRIFKREHDEERTSGEATRALFLFCFAPALFIFLLSWILPYSTWGTRHLIIAAGPYSILAAISLRSLQPYWIRISVFLVLWCWFLLAGTLFVVIRPSPFIWCAWEQLARQVMVVESGAAEVVPVYAYEDLVAYHLWFALDPARNARFKDNLVKGLPGVVNDPAYFLPRSFNDVAIVDGPVLEGRHLWIAFRTSQKGEKWDETSPLLNLAKGMGYQVGRVFSTKSQGQEAFLVELRRTAPPL